MALYSKSIRKLHNSWHQLTKLDNFIIPQTIEEYRRLGGFFAAKIKVDKTEAVFNEAAKGILKEFLVTLCELPELKHSISFETIYHKTINFIGKTVHDQAINSVKPESKRDIKNLIDLLLREQLNYQIFRIIEGVNLEKIRSMTFGDVELFIFSEDREKELDKYREVNNERGFYDDYIKKFIQQHYLGKACIRTIVTGDSSMAKQIAYKRFKQVINLLRFMICISSQEGVHENRLKVNLMSEAYNASERGIQINMDSHVVSMDHGPSRNSVQSFPVDDELIEYLRRHCNYDDWIDILAKNKKTELEEAILNAIYWIGEAQNEYDRESAFVKYWTALETLFTVTNTEITETLAKGVAILLAFGGYGVIQPEKVSAIFSATSKLYKKRSKIIHRGIYEHIGYKDLTDICNYAVSCVLSCFNLRKKGYATLTKIRDENDRLYKLAVIKASR